MSDPPREPDPADRGRRGDTGARGLPGADDAELASHAAAFRAELRADAAAWEQLAATDQLRRRSLADAAHELLARGDQVAVVVAGWRAVGEVVHVGDDLACVSGEAGVVDVRLDAPAVLWQVVARRRAGGRSVAGGATTFAARLAEHEAAGARVTLVCPHAGAEVTGRIAAVAGDHVVVDDVDSRWLLPREAVAAVWPGG